MIRRPAQILIGSLALGYSTPILLADLFTWQPNCDERWATCCGDQLKENNWGRTQFMTCPPLPSGAHDVLIESDIFVGGAAGSGRARNLVQTAGMFTFEGLAAWSVAERADFHSTVQIHAAAISGASISGVHFHMGAEYLGPSESRFGNSGPARIVNHGLLIWRGGEIDFNGGVSDNNLVRVENEVGAIWEIAGDGNWWRSSPAEFINRGTLTKSGTTGTIRIDPKLINEGTIQVDSGIIEIPSISSSGSNSGEILIAPGAAVHCIGQNFDLLPGGNIRGDFRVAGGVQSGTPAVRVSSAVTIDEIRTTFMGHIGGAGPLRIAQRMDVAGGKIATPVVILPGAHLDVSLISHNFARLTIRGTGLVHTGATLGCQNQSLLIQPGGVLEVEDDTIVRQTGIASIGIDVSGVLRKNATPGTAIVEVIGGAPFQTQAAGRIEALGGTLDLRPPLSHSGTLHVENGATIELKSNATTFASGSVLSGNGTISIAGPPANLAIVLAPGAPTGALSIDATTLSLASGADVRIDIAGSAAGGAFDSVNVIGELGVDGTLAINLLNGFVPAVGEVYEVMHAALRTGTFSSVVGTEIGSGRSLEVSYTDTSVLLTVVSDTPLVGDIDGDGSVDLTDLSILLAAFGSCAGDAAYLAAADLNASGCVGLEDLASLLQNFGL